MSILPPFLGLLLAPLFLGVVNRTKALFGGRHGQPLLQGYYDLQKLLRKGTVLSRTTSWIFRAGPVAALSCALVALLLIPFGATTALVAFPGDFILLGGLLALVRFATVLAALDTGSSFEGMGASRELQFGGLCEPVFYLVLAVFVQRTGLYSLSGIYGALPQAISTVGGPALALAGMSLFAVFLAENARIPFDDPATHLELTMIHEVMVLDHSGPDFAFISYGAALKHWIAGVLLAGLAVAPLRTGIGLVDAGAVLAAMFALAVLVGAVESAMARLRLLRAPQLLAGAGALSALALLIGLME